MTIRLQGARWRLSRSHPYLSSALWRLESVEESRCPTMGVDEHWRLYVNKEWVAGLSVEVLGTALYHEIMHLLRVHPARCKGASAIPKVWNIAADAEINDDLKEESLPFWDGVVLPEGLGLQDGLLAEEYYNELMKNVTVVEVAVGPCGSCATGHREKWELPGAGGISAREKKLIRQAVAEAVREQLSGKNRGKVPGHWKRWADRLLTPPKVPWERELASHLRKSLSMVAGRVDYSYSRPSRRQSAYGRVVMPSLRQPCPNVGVLVDTSGSMSESDLQDALGEVRGILLSVGQRNGVPVMAVDAAVQSTRRVFDARQVEVIGGGGTDMRVGLDAMKGLRPRPGVVVVLTDGWTPWPEEPQPFSVIVALIGKDHSNSVPGWARTVVVE